MDNRHAATYQSLLRIVQFVDRHDSMREVAAKSNAVTLLVEHIDQFETLTEQQSTVSFGLRGVTAQRKVVKRLIWERLDTIRCAADYARLRDPAVTPFSVPAISTHDAVFAAAARGMITVAQDCVEVLAANGLQRSVIGEIGHLVDALDRLVVARNGGAGSRHGATDAIPVVLRSARKLVPLIYHQLASAMTPELRSEWKQSASLGRVHRPTAVGSGGKRRLGSGNGSAAGLRLPSIAGLMRRVVQRLAGVPAEGSGRGAPLDYSVSEVRRLPGLNGASSAGERDEECDKTIP